MKKLYYILLIAIICSSLSANTLYGQQNPALEASTREGRDFIDREEWAKASDKFQEIVAKYPQNNKMDAALYWLAFSYRKQKSYKLAIETIDKMVKDYPSSSWVGDALVMKAQMVSEQARTSRPLLATTVPGQQGSASSNGVYSASATQLQGELFRLSVTNEQLAVKLPLEREDEVRLAAFQSLLSSDGKRAIEIIGSMLRTDSKATENLKREMLRTLVRVRQQRLPQLMDNIVLLRETLVKSFQSESSLRIRKSIIYALASLADEASIRRVYELYSIESDKEIKKAIIESLNIPAQNYSGFYDTSKTSAKPGVMRTIIAQMLTEILRTEKDVELRRLAAQKIQMGNYGNLYSYANSTASFDLLTPDQLIQLYDAETDEELKTSYLNLLIRTKQPPATKKILDIAKNDKSDKLRLAAINSLSGSKDPEVLKFLEELIK